MLCNLRIYSLHLRSKHLQRTQNLAITEPTIPIITTATTQPLILAAIVQMQTVASAVTTETTPITEQMEPANPAKPLAHNPIKAQEHKRTMNTTTTYQEREALKERRDKSLLIRINTMMIKWLQSLDQGKIPKRVQTFPYISFQHWIILVAPHHFQQRMSLIIAEVWTIHNQTRHSLTQGASKNQAITFQTPNPVPKSLSTTSKRPTTSPISTFPRSPNNPKETPPHTTSAAS